MNSFSNEMFENITLDESQNKQSCISLVNKFKDEENLLKNIQKIVNRQWNNVVNASKTSSDMFWLLGTGNINCNGQEEGVEQLVFIDHIYDTTKFTVIWPTEHMVFENYSDLVKYNMALNNDGTVIDGNADRWWLRSSCYESSGLIGRVGTNGGIDCLYENYGCGVSPAFTIG